MVPETLAIAPLVALTLGAVGLGGGLYETLLVDPVWPRNPAVIQPRRGGLDRKRFWGPVHGLFEVALLVSAWTGWGDAAARPVRRRALRALGGESMVVRVFHSLGPSLREDGRP